jgi:hypothetical protein
MLISIRTGSGRRPSVISTRPSGLNLTIMSVPSSTGPDVVLRIDAHRVREGEAVVVAADLADKYALRTVFEEPRLVGAMVDVDIPLRVGGNPHVLAGVDARRVLEEVHDRLVRDGRNVGRRRFCLC